MSRHIRFVAYCLYLTTLSGTVTARMVPTFYASANNKYNQFFLNRNYNDEQTSNAARLSSGFSQIPQVENKFSQPSIDVNLQQNSYMRENSVLGLGNTGKYSLENIFQNNNEWQNQGIGYGENALDLKSSTPFKGLTMMDSFGIKPSEIEVDPSSPHLIKVPVPQPYPVHIPVRQPFTVPIFKIVPQEVEKKIPIPVEKLVPVYKNKPVKIIVEKHHPVPVYKPYAVPIPVNTHVLIGKKRPQNWGWYGNGNYNSYY